MQLRTVAAREFEAALHRHDIVAPAVDHAAQGRDPLGFFLPAGEVQGRGHQEQGAGLQRGTGLCRDVAAHAGAHQHQAVARLGGEGQQLGHALAGIVGVTIIRAEDFVATLARGHGKMLDLGAPGPGFLAMGENHETIGKVFHV